MKELTDAERLEIAIDLLMERELETYIHICELVEQGMSINEAYIVAI